jgi:hypothetical protein
MLSLAFGRMAQMWQRSSRTDRLEVVSSNTTLFGIVVTNICEAAVDNSGAISMSTSRASVLEGMWLRPCSLAVGLSMGLALL